MYFGFSRALGLFAGSRRPSLLMIARQSPASYRSLK